MKLRSRKADTDDASTSAPKKAKMDSFESIHPGMLVSYGKFGKCFGSECDGVPMATADSEVDNRRFCRQCAEKEGPLLGRSKWWHEYLTYDPSDAEFKCPAYNTDGSCKSLKVSFEEFYLGSCCQPASTWLIQNKKGQEKKLKTIRQFYDSQTKRSNSASMAVDHKKKDLWKAERKLKEQRKKLEEMKKQIEECEKSVAEEERALEDARKKARDEDEKTEPYIKRYKQVLYEYHSVATELSLDNEQLLPGSKKDICGLCNKYYDEINRKSALSKCGHIACSHCLVMRIQLERRSCPFGESEKCNSRYYRHRYDGDGRDDDNGGIITLYD